MISAPNSIAPTAARTRIAYEPYEPADPVRLPPRLLAIVAVVIAILLVAGYAIWRSGIADRRRPRRARPARRQRRRDRRAATAARRRSPARPAAPPPPAAVGGAVRLTAIKPVWFEVTDARGATLFTGTLDQGKTFDVPATAVDPVIRTGKPEGLAVTVGGQPVAPLGEPAQHHSNVSLKAAALLRARRRRGRRPPPAARARRRRVAPPRAASRRPSARRRRLPRADDAIPSAFRAADGNAAAPQPQP